MPLGCLTDALDGNHEIPAIASAIEQNLTYNLLRSKEQLRLCFRHVHWDRLSRSLGEDVRFFFLNFHHEFLRPSVEPSSGQANVNRAASSTFRFSINRGTNIVARRAEAVRVIHLTRCIGSFSIVSRSFRDPAIFRAVAIQNGGAISCSGNWPRIVAQLPADACKRAVCFARRTNSIVGNLHGVEGWMETGPAFLGRWLDLPPSATPRLSEN